MDLSRLLTAANSAEEPAGQQRVAALTDHIRSLDGVNLADLETSAVAEFDRLHADGNYQPGDVATMEAIADLTEALRAVATEQQQAQADRVQKVQSLTDRIKPADPAPTEPDDDDGGTGQDEPGGQPAGDQDAPADAPVADTVDPGQDTPTAEPATPEPVDDGGRSTPDDVPAQSGPDTGGSATPDSTPAAPAAPEPVPASAAPARRPSTTAAINQSRTAVPHTSSDQQAKPLRRFTITASAEVPNTPYGKELTLSELSEATAARFATFPVGEATAGTLKANVARINRHHDDSILLKGDHGDPAIIDAVADEKRLPGGSLVAATQKAITAAAQAPSTIQDVWCTPSETDFTLCAPLATTDGMWDVPTTGLPARGGIRYPVWTQYPEQDGWHGQVVPYPQPNPRCDPDTLPSGGLAEPDWFHQKFDENGQPLPPAQQGGYPKKCIEGPCVEWCEVRASLSYLCITSNILQDRTFPEGIERFTSDVLVHHQHYLNETYLNHVTANADPIPAFSVQNGAGQIGSTSLTVVDRLALLVTWMRSAYKMAEGATLEIVMPEWFREYLKRDIEKKQNRPFRAVSDAEIAGLFAEYTSRVQWVRDWQEMGNGTPVGGRVMPPNDWPTSVNILAYPAGSWVLSQGNILTLGVQYDHQLLRENRYAAMFTEDSWMLVNRCNRTFLVQLTDLCANGAVGPEVNACPRANAVAVTLDPASITAGSTSQGTATATMPDGSTPDVTSSAAWSSSDPAIATVNGQGEVTGVAAGTATITARYGGQAGTADITVTAAALAASSDQQQGASDDDTAGTTSGTGSGGGGGSSSRGKKSS